MKRLILVLIAVLIVGVLYGQTNNNFKYPITVGATSPAINGQITLKGGTSGTVVIKVPAVAGTGTIFQLPTSNGVSGYVLRTDGSGVLSWVEPNAAEMVYPAAGIALSSGSEWSGSITNNSTNWNTAYSDRLKWDGGSTGLTAATGRTSLGGSTVGQSIFTLSDPSAVTFLRLNADNTVTALSAANFKTALSLVAGDVSLGNVTNESKATMFTSPTLTGTAVLPSTTSIGNVSSTEIGYVDGVTSAVQTQLNNKADTAGQIDLELVFPKLVPDTVQHTASYTVATSDWGKDQHCLRATPIGITIPANLSAWPVGGVMNFYGEGAGIMVFKKSGVTFISDTDSIATSRKGQAVTIKKIATNKYFLVGPLTD